jgi:hypothetical protein
LNETSLTGVIEKGDAPVDMFAELMEELENEAVKPEKEQAVVINLVMGDTSDQQIYCKKDLPVEDRRLRKKEQNKTAATRYRQKKKAELKILLDDEASLAIRNKELNRKYEDLFKEVSYLKKLMRDVLLAQKSKS